MDLVVGDLHTTVEDLEDSTYLMDFVLKTAKDHKVSRVILLGDLHHNFSVTNVRVTAFYRKWFKRFSDDEIKVIALVGNHDMPGDGSGYPHALCAYDDLIQVVDEPVLDPFKILYLPYYPNPNLFLEKVSRFPNAKLIYCHQEFNGAMYDNGFYAPNGVNPAEMQVPVISGHIHTTQTLFGTQNTIWYPGAPRWRTLSDAAQEKRHIYLVEYSYEGNSLKGYKVETEIETNEICRRIIEVKITPERPYIQTGDTSKDHYRIRVEGPATFVKSFVLDPSVKHSRVSTFITDDKVIRVRESDGVHVAFGKYLDSYKPKSGHVELVREIAVRRLNEA